MKKLVASLVLSTAALHAAAQGSWPQQPVKVIVPYSAGGIVDFSARALSQKLSAPEAFAQLIRDETKRWGELARAAGVKPE